MKKDPMVTRAAKEYEATLRRGAKSRKIRYYRSRTFDFTCKSCGEKTRVRVGVVPGATFVVVVVEKK